MTSHLWAADRDQVSVVFSAELLSLRPIHFLIHIMIHTIRNIHKYGHLQSWRDKVIYNNKKSGSILQQSRRYSPFEPGPHFKTILHITSCVHILQFDYVRYSSGRWVTKQPYRAESILEEMPKLNIYKCWKWSLLDRVCLWTRSPLIIWP